MRRGVSAGIRIPVLLGSLVNSGTSAVRGGCGEGGLFCAGRQGASVWQPARQLQRGIRREDVLAARLGDGILAVHVGGVCGRDRIPYPYRNCRSRRTRTRYHCRRGRAARRVRRSRMRLNARLHVRRRAACDGEPCRERGQHNDDELALPHESPLTRTICPRSPAAYTAADRRPDQRPTHRPRHPPPLSHHPRPAPRDPNGVNGCANVPERMGTVPHPLVRSEPPCHGRRSPRARPPRTGRGTARRRPAAGPGPVRRRPGTRRPGAGPPG